MKSMMFVAALATIMCSGCVHTIQTSEVTVRKDANGKITGTDYTERLEQEDFLPWSKHFGKYLFNQ